MLLLHVRLMNNNFVSEFRNVAHSVVAGLKEARGSRRSPGNTFESLRRDYRHTQRALFQPTDKTYPVSYLEHLLHHGRLRKCVTAFDESTACLRPSMQSRRPQGHTILHFRRLQPLRWQP
jgi:hypothetical protein